MRKFMLVAIVVLSVVAMPATALATPPDIFTYEDWTDSDPTWNYCDASYEGGPFYIQMALTADIVDKLFYDKEGNLVRITESVHSDEMTLTNSVTGRTIHNHWDFTITIDLVEGTRADIGQAWHLALPEGGHVVLGTGRLVTELGNYSNVLFSAGPKVLDWAGQLCPYVAGD